MTFEIGFVSWNLVVFFAFGADKYFARRRKGRIAESTLILMSLILGGFGGILGMVVFNHKTSKGKFRWFVPVGAILTGVAAWFLVSGDLWKILGVTF